MKRINKYILTFSLATFFLAGCADMLDIEPANSIDASKGISTSSDVEALLVGAYSAMGDGDVYGGNILRDAELIADDLDNPELFWDGTFVAPGEIWTKSMLVTNDQAQSTWLDSYEAINICNTVLANLEVVTPEKTDQVEGEAKFIRAAIYFELVRTFAKTWTDGNPASNPGVPIVLEPTDASNISILASRDPVSEVYDQVISDLNDAAALLPDDNGFFANRFAAHAILSRVYLMQNDYAKAADHASIVIEESGYSLESSYADAFNKTSPSSSSEDIFAIQVTDQDGINEMNTFFASSDFGGRGDIYIEQNHFDLYEPNDDRLNLFYDDERCGKWKNIFGNVTIIRLAEMYLTRAEANFREGTSVGADPIDDINTIRNRVNLSDLVTLTLDDILLERHLELAFEGHRMHDIKRTQGSVGTLPYSDPSLVFPIPQRELNINPDLGQNQGYGN